ncbi:hypothetical protein BDZ94DRAFT_1347583, partial [Collybia nuda]
MYSHGGLPDLILVAEKELINLAEQVQRARLIYEDLLVQHASKFAQITHYRLAVAADKMLPPELLSEIFLFCVDDHPVILPPKRAEIPWNLSYVCSRWRAVALDTAALWRNLRIELMS